MYKLTDVVEVGHDVFIGGSVTISLEFDNILSQTEKEQFLKIIDYLDHSTITSNADMLEYTERFFLLDKSTSLFEDIQTLLFHFIKEDLVCTVTLGKESFTNNLSQTSNVIKFNHKG